MRTVDRLPLDCHFDAAGCRTGPTHLRTELAAAAARLIAEEGCDYAPGKTACGARVAGRRADTRGACRTMQRSNANCGAICNSSPRTTHPALLAELRHSAADVMSRSLSTLIAHLVGPCCRNGHRHSDIELHLFTDSAKDVEVFLMNAGIEFDVEAVGRRSDPGAFEWLVFHGAPRAQVAGAADRRAAACLRAAMRSGWRRAQAVPSADFEFILSLPAAGPVCRHCGN